MSNLDWLRTHLATLGSERHQPLPVMFDESPRVCVRDDESTMGSDFELAALMELDRAVKRGGLRPVSTQHLLTAEVDHVDLENLSQQWREKLERRVARAARGGRPWDVPE